MDTRINPTLAQISQELIALKAVLEQTEHKVGVNTLEDIINRITMPETKQILSKESFYQGELNTKRIAAYKKLHEQYNIDESSTRDIFCAGLDFALQTLSASPEAVGDKFEFVEWIRKNDWQPFFDGKWINKNSVGVEYKTTAELYQLFKQSKL